MIERASGPAPARVPAPQDVPWGIADVLVSAVIVLIVEVVGVNVLVVALPSVYHQHQLLFNVLAYQCLTLGVALSSLWVLVRHRASPTLLGFHFPGWQTLARCLLAVPILMVGVAILYGLFTTFLPGYHLQGNARELLQGHSSHFAPALQVLVVLWAAVQAPLTEETLFRGLWFQGLRHTFARRIPVTAAIFLAAVVTGVLFGAVHEEPHTFPILAFMGILLAYVFQWSRSIYGSALVHGTINAIAVISLFHH